MRFRNGVPPSDHFFIDDEESSLHFHDLYDRTYDRPWKVIDPIQTKLLIWKIKSNRKKHIIVASVLTSKYLPFLRLSNLQQIYTLFFSSILCKDFPFNRIPLLTNKNFWKDPSTVCTTIRCCEGRSWASKCEETFGKHSFRFWERKGKARIFCGGSKKLNFLRLENNEWCGRTPHNAKEFCNEKKIESKVSKWKWKAPLFPLHK